MESRSVWLPSLAENLDPQLFRSSEVPEIFHEAIKLERPWRPDWTEPLWVPPQNYGTKTQFIKAEIPMTEGQSGSRINSPAPPVHYGSRGVSPVPQIYYGSRASSPSPVVQDRAHSGELSPEDQYIFEHGPSKSFSGYETPRAVSPAPPIPLAIYLPEDREHSESLTVDQSFPTTTSHPTMSPEERTWWGMTFEDLFQFAKKKKFRAGRYVRRKSGRTRIIQWLCEKEGIIPYAATRSAPSNEAISKTIVRESGAIAHPESMLTTSDSALQRLIDEAEQKYRLWTSAQLHELSMQRSYQLLKDSNGKLPSKSAEAMVKWLATWDVLKSPREKKWWLGDGISLVNKAKAMGYRGPSREYEVIVWLRTTPEDSEVEVAEPTPNKSSTKRLTGDEGLPVSKRRAKGSTRPDW